MAWNFGGRVPPSIYEHYGPKDRGRCQTCHYNKNELITAIIIAEQ